MLGNTLQLKPDHLLRSGQRFGNALQLSADGRWLVVGAALADQNPAIDGDNQLDVGRVYLFQQRNSGWAVARDVAGTVKLGQLGRSVALGATDVLMGNGTGGVWDYRAP